MKVAVKDLCGIGRIPTHRTSVSGWLRRHGVGIQAGEGKGGVREVVALNDLPEPERLAYFERLAARAGLDAGAQDDAAHIELMKAPLTAQERAHDSAAKLLFIVKREQLGMTWPEIATAGRANFPDFPSRNTMKGWKRKIDGIAPANWAPALAPAWTGSGTGDPISEEAWDRLLELMKLSGKNGTGFPLKHAYHIVAREAVRFGWDWPKLHTVRRRWKAMDPAERDYATFGEDVFKARYFLHRPQHSIGMSAMDAVHGDGREFDVRVRWPDGTESCPWVVAFVDYASRKTVGWAVGRSENSDVTEQALIRMCETHYRPSKLTFDNGGAFNSKRIAGGQRPFFRTRGTRDADWEVPGVLTILGIELANTGVAAKRPNLQENVWSHLRHTDNHPAFYGAQRPGPNDPDISTPGAVPIEDFEAVLAHDIDRINSNTENRVTGLAKGESRDAGFERLLTSGAKRVVTPLMRRQLAMVWKRKTVGRDGRIKFDHGLFGDHTTQPEMLRHAGREVLVGFDPRDFDAGAMVCHWADKRNRGRLILEELPAVRATLHGSEEGRRLSVTEKRRVRDLCQKHRLSDPEAKAAALREEQRARGQTAPRMATTDQVVELPRGTGLMTRPVKPETDERITGERWRQLLENLDQSIERDTAAKF